MARARNSWALRVGYVRASAVLDRAFTLLFCLLLLLIAGPLMLVVSLVLLALNGPPVLYSGWRLGKHKKLFRMYKFRTLIPQAQNLIGAELFTTRLTSNRDMLTRSGQFLRDTRLDELPQLFNILRGDMDFLGPRPERPEIYEKFCKDIKGYDRRFSVKPGLIGYSQIFTPHSTPKRIRHFIDYRFLKYRHRYSFEVTVVLLALFMLFFRLLYRTYLAMRDSLSNLLNNRPEHRILERWHPDGVTLLIEDAAAGGSGTEVEGALKDINEEALLVYTMVPITATALHLKLVVQVKNWRGREVGKTIYCTGEVYQESRNAPEPYRFSYVVKYSPESARNNYLVHQYLLSASIVHTVRTGRQAREAKVALAARRPLPASASQRSTERHGA